MNVRERIKNTLTYQPCDHLPLIHFGYWNELLDEWAVQGHVSRDEARLWQDGNDVCRELGRRLGFDCNWATVVSSEDTLLPRFPDEVVAVLPNGDRHVRNWCGVTELVAAGAGSIPAEIDHLLVDRASWEEHFKWRLVWSPERLEPDPAARVAQWNAATDHAAILFAGSVIGIIRNWLGVVNLSYLQIDDPELLEEIIVTCADLAYRNVEAWFQAGLRPDFLHWWEDICFNHGPLVSPEFFRTHCVPYYRRTTALARQYGCALASVDCDGMIEELLELWLDGGVNIMFPIEIGTWHPDFLDWRRRYGRELCGVGGMNKHVLGKDRAAVDAEIERLRPWIDGGGFIPCPDHRLPPGTRWELVQYYTDRMRQLF